MTKTKHTAGEWASDPAMSSDLDHIRVITADGKIIASVRQRNDQSQEEALANAQLLSAAPRLLVAAETMLAWIELLVTQCMDANVDGFEIELTNSKSGESTTVRLADNLAEARAAIARATGGAA